MPKRKPKTEMTVVRESGVTEISESFLPEDAPKRLPVPLEETDLCVDPDFLNLLYRRQELAAKKAEVQALDREYKGLGVGLALNMENAGVKSIDLGNGTILEWISGPGPVTYEMVKEMVADLLRAGVQPEVLKAAVERLDEARRAATWFSVKFVKAVKEA